MKQFFTILFLFTGSVSFSMQRSDLNEARKVLTACLNLPYKKATVPIPEEVLKVLLIPEEGHREVMNVDYADFVDMVGKYLQRKFSSASSLNVEWKKYLMRLTSGLKSEVEKVYSGKEESAKDPCQSLEKALNILSKL